MDFKGDQVGVNVALKVGLKLGLSQVKFLTRKKHFSLKYAMISGLIAYTG